MKVMSPCQVLSQANNKLSNCFQDGAVGADLDKLQIEDIGEF